LTLIKNNAPYRVFLPPKMFEEARDREHFKQLLAEYMKHYPNYIVKRIEKGFALCERRD